VTVPELQGVPEIVAVVAVVDVVIARHMLGRVGLPAEYEETLRLYGETPPPNAIVT